MPRGKLQSERDSVDLSKRVGLYLIACSAAVCPKQAHLTERYVPTVWCLRFHRPENYPH